MKDLDQRHNGGFLWAFSQRKIKLRNNNENFQTVGDLDNKKQT